MLLVINKHMRYPQRVMRDAPSTSPALCARFHRASELIGRRWTGAIIFVLLKSRCRFAVLRQAIPEITDRMLSERLQELEHEGILTRTVVPDTPIRVEYALTRKGRALAAAIKAITDWAHKWVEAEAPAGNRLGSYVRNSRASETEPKALPRNTR
jgi:DNA-binding HxlR family transcriptional regulator